MRPRGQTAIRLRLVDDGRGGSCDRLDSVPPFPIPRQHVGCCRERRAHRLRVRDQRRHMRRTEMPRGVFEHPCQGDPFLQPTLCGQCHHQAPTVQIHGSIFVYSVCSINTGFASRLPRS